MLLVPRSILPVFVVLLACAAGSAHADASEGSSSHVFPALDGNFVAERVSQGVSQPAALEFRPGGRLLIAQRDRGLITVADPASGAMTDVTGLRPLVVSGDAGVHDIELHPDDAQNGWVYVSYTGCAAVYSAAVVDRFRLAGSEADVFTRVFTADAYSEGAHHLAARMAFVDGYLFVAFGDREHPPMAQDNSNHEGTLVRLHDDGSVPLDNPLAAQTEEGKPAPLPEIWSCGHRDPMGLYRHPATNTLWLHEHAPRGGDEVQREGEVVAEERLAQRLRGRVRSIEVDAAGSIYQSATTARSGNCGRNKGPIETPLPRWHLGSRIRTDSSQCRAPTCPPLAATPRRLTPSCWRERIAIHAA